MVVFETWKFACLARSDPLGPCTSFPVGVARKDSGLDQPAWSHSPALEREKRGCGSRAGGFNGNPRCANHNAVAPWLPLLTVGSVGEARFERSRSLVRTVYLRPGRITQAALWCCQPRQLPPPSPSSFHKAFSRLSDTCHSSKPIFTSFRFILPWLPRSVQALADAHPHQNRPTLTPRRAAEPQVRGTWYLRPLPQPTSLISLWARTT